MDFDYISELKAPSLQCQKDGSLPSPQAIEAYFASVEQKRQEFLSFLTDKNQNTIEAYLDELILAKNTIEKRGFVSLPVGNIATAVTGGVEGADTLFVLKDLDTRLLASTESTISFIKSLLGEDNKEIVHTAEPVKTEKQDEVIRGVKGLAEFLNIGTTKAQAIINSSVLLRTKPPIQYRAGGWMFNKSRLQEYWDNHPTFVDDVKCPH